MTSQTCFQVNLNRGQQNRTVGGIVLYINILKSHLTWVRSFLVSFLT